MSEKPRILEQARAIREVRQALDLARNPWSAGRALYTPVISAVFVAVITFVPREILPERYWWCVGFAVFVLISHLDNRHRDRAWRKLIEYEAPDLHRKIVSKEEADA